MRSSASPDHSEPRRPRCATPPKQPRRRLYTYVHNSAYECVRVLTGVLMLTSLSPDRVDASLQLLFSLACLVRYVAGSGAGTSLQSPTADTTRYHA
jgi:hypothetical protein